MLVFIDMLDNNYISKYYLVKEVLHVPEEFKPGCQRPPIKKTSTDEVNTTSIPLIREEGQKMIKVGKPAPDFTASAFFKGKFVNFSLSEFKGKWVLLCFYPGDFTFV